MKLNNAIFLLKAFLLGCISALLISCENDELSADDKKLLEEAKARKEQNKINVVAKKEILDAMNEVYLWYDKLNPSILNKEQDPESFYYEMLYRAFDKWSFMLDSTEFDNFVNARYYGHGFGASVDYDGSLMVTYVFKNTTAYNKGIRRGWKFFTVNGQSPKSPNHLFDLLGPEDQQVSNSITFVKPDYSYENVSLTKEEITINPVLKYDVIDVDGINTGYMALQSFLGDSALVVNEFYNVFNQFKSKNIQELVIDLRYNGGGSLDYSLLLANLIIGQYEGGNKFVSEKYNDLIDQYIADKSIYLKNEPRSLAKRLERIFFITNNESASASEMIIACLEPYINVQVIGSRTSGKPVGMKALDMKKSSYILVPVMFTWLDANNKSISYTGIPVDQPELDDMKHDLGDPQEACLAQALHFIKTGSYKNSKKSTVEIPAKDTKGYRAYRNVY